MMMKRFLTSKEAAEYLDITENELSGLSASRRITAYKVGGIYTRFKIDDLEAYRRKGMAKPDKNCSGNFSAISDFLYFNDFYIYSGIIIAAALYFIFKKP